MKRFELRVDPLTNEIYYDVHLLRKALRADQKCHVDAEVLSVQV